MKQLFLAISIVFSVFACTSKTEHAKLTFLLKGNESFEEGNLEKASYYYKEAILTDSTYVDAYLNNALVLVAKGKYYDAIEMYDALLAMNPMNEDVLFKRANLYLDVDQYYRALDDLDILNKTWVDSADLYFTKGLVNTKLKRYLKAVEEFKHSLALAQHQPQAYINIGNVFYYQNELDSSIFYINKGLSLDSLEVNGLNTLGLIATKKGNFNDAIILFNNALKVDKKNGWFVNNKAFAFLQLGQFDSAAYLINESMKMDPYNAWVYRNKGLLELGKNNIPRAVQLLTKAYKMDSSIDNIINDLASAYQLNNELDKACKLINRVKNAIEKEKLKAEYCL